MSSPDTAPVLAKLLFAVLYNDKEQFSRAQELLSSLFGKIDSESDPYPFADTNYYEAEMGAALYRHFFSVEPLINPADLAAIKHKCAALETEMSAAGSRLVNIDPGYLDLGKYVLASYKAAPTKLYIGEGVYADLTLLFHDHTFSPLPWSFPDFRSGIYNEYLLKLRYDYRRQRRQYL